MSGRCVDCGYLSFRATVYGSLRFRGHSGYHEVEQTIRDAPRATEEFIPGDANAVQGGEFGCFRAASNLSDEIADLVNLAETPQDDAATEVVNAHRDCPKWTPYVPGLTPGLHYQELNAKALEEDRRVFYKQMSALEGQQTAGFQKQNWRLALIAVLVALFIGAVQVAVGLVPDSLAYRKVCRTWPAICTDSRPANFKGS